MVFHRRNRRSLYSSTMNDPADDLLRISMSHGLPRCLHAVAELGIADALGESPRSAEELARDTGTDAGALARTLRVLSAEGIFEARDGAWGHTPASRLLRSDHPQSMRSFVRMIGLPVYWRGFEYFADALVKLLPLQADGLVEVGDTNIVATSRGRMLLRIIAMAFDRYLPPASDTAATRFSRTV